MLILKSSSPRRKEILENQKLIFTVEPSHIDESEIEKEIFKDYLKRVTLNKLEPSKCLNANVYIASDTIVVLNGKILAKPIDREDGIRTLLYLSGKVHSVFSSLVIWKNGTTVYDFDETEVEFKKWKSEDCANYFDGQLPVDKAGAYGIQDQNGPVDKFTGSYSNVLGFPIRKFYQHFELWKEFLR